MKPVASPWMPSTPVPDSPSASGASAINSKRTPGNLSRNSRTSSPVIDRRAAHWEHTIAVTAEGHEIFTLSPAGLHRPLSDAGTVEGYRQ